MKRHILLFLCIMLYGLSAVGQTDDWRMAVSGIMELWTEQNPEADIEQLEQQLLDLQRCPIDINRATSEQLEQLFWLTPEQIDAILMYVWHQPMQTLYELQLVNDLHDWDIRLMLPFVTVVPTDRSQQLTLGDCLLHASHELDIRLDARNLEQFSGDPVYGLLRYSLQGGTGSGKAVQMGAVLKRDPGEIPDRNSRYGAYLQLNDVWRFRTLVAGDYRANFGLGLVMNASMPMGKSSMAANLGMRQQGLRKYGGASDDFLRGAGATLRLGAFDLSAFCSLRMPRKMAAERLPDSGWEQTAGLNMQYRHNRLRIGLTAVNYRTKDSVSLRDNYYNGHYFRGRNQLSASLCFQYGIRNVMLLGEVAAAQNTHWGAAGILGARWTPAPDVQLMLLGRYYSPWYDAKYASAFGEGSRNNDEHGIYLGADITRLRHWRFNLYSDFFCFSGPKYMIRDSLTWGYDLFAQAACQPSRRFDMLWRARAKRKGQKDLYSFRWQLNNHWEQWSLRTQLDANLCRPDLRPLTIFESSDPVSLSSELSDLRHPSPLREKVPAEQAEESFTYGFSLMEQVEYRAAKVPLTLQLRLQGFYIPHYDNRVYTYENDVLYAFSIPMVYGVGARYYANLRYRITDRLALYLRASDTWYTRHWAEQQDRPAHKTDVHLMLRVMM